MKPRASMRLTALFLAVILALGSLGPNMAYAMESSNLENAEITMMDQGTDTTSEPTEGDESASDSELVVDEPNENETSDQLPSETEEGPEEAEPSPSGQPEADASVPEDEEDLPTKDDVLQEEETASPDESAPSEEVLPSEEMMSQEEALPQEELQESEEDAFNPHADSGAGTGGESEDVAQTPSKDVRTMAADDGEAVSVHLKRDQNGVSLSYAADAATVFQESSLAPGQVWVDKSVKKTDNTETSFEESLAVYAKKFTSTSEYATGNYVLVVDVTHSIYNADTSGALFVAMTKAINDLAVEICKNPLSNVSVIAFSADQNASSKNKNPYATSVILGMGNWNKAGSALLTANVSSSNEYSWFIGPTTKAEDAGIASTGKRYLSKGTFTQAGIAHAASILKAQTDKANTTGYIILFTDGVPTFATTSWASNYTASGEQWASGSSYSLGTGDYVSSAGYAYTLLTMQYWKHTLSGQYKDCYLYAGHFSNDTYNSNVEKVGKWVSGVTNNVTYTATDSASTNASGYYGSLISSGYPKNRLASTFANYTADKDYQSVANSVEKLKALLTGDNLNKLGLSSASTFNAPCIAQFCSLSAYDNASKKQAALSHLISNLETSIQKDKVTQGGLKAGTDVVFTTQTGPYMTVSGDPVMYYNNTAYSGTKSGTTYTYAIQGETVTVSVISEDDHSCVTVTVPAELVNKNGMEDNHSPILCQFGVDLFTTDYKEVYELAAGDVTTYTNNYSDHKTTATFTTAEDNPYYATTGTETVNKTTNTTGTLSYVCSTVKTKSGNESTATLGNNGKLDLSFQWGKIEILAWEINQADETKVLPNVTYHMADEQGNLILLDGEELTFTSTDAVITIECMPAGTYQLVVDSVPPGYVVPEPMTITVEDSTETQHFDLYVPTICIDVWAIDQTTEEVVDGVKVTVYDASGTPVYQDVSLEFVQEYVPAGDYTIQVTWVPDRYLMPEDTPITVEAIREKQDFIIPLEHLGSITIHKYDAQHQPLKGVSFDLLDASGTIIMTRTTDENGEAVFLDEDKLVPGTYTVTETKTNSGLTLLRDAIEVTIPVTMTDTEVEEQHADTSKGWHNEEEKLWYFYDVSYEISNNTQFSVPMTGGNNLMVWLLGFTGFVCIVGSAYYLIRIVSRKN